MKNNLLITVSFIFILTIAILGKTASSVKAVKVWDSEPTLRVPESVMYDPVRKVLYVSNINGTPTQKNGKGFISRVSMKGKVLTLRWITGMNAPKGMGIFKGKLFVTDIDRVHEIDIATGKILRSVVAKGAQFLNDIAISREGDVFISDMTISKIYRLRNRKNRKNRKNRRIEDWLTLDYKRANGLFLYKGKLLIGTAKGILSTGLNKAKPKLLISHEGGIDGLKYFGNSTWIISDWKGKTELIGRTRKILLNTSAQEINSADFEYIPEKKLIIIPTFFNNRIVGYRLK